MSLLNLTPRDQRWLQRAGIAVDAPDQLAEELARIAPGGHVTHEDARAMAALRIALGKERWRADLGAEREDVLQKRLDSVGAEKDAALELARRNDIRGTLWMLCSWALLVVMFAGVVWKWSGR